MPGVGGTYIGDPDLDAIDANAGAVQVGQDTRNWASFTSGFDDFQRAGHLITEGVGEGGGFPLLGFADPTIPADEANAKYGTPTLRFNAPVGEADAAFQSQMHHEAEWRSSVFAQTKPTPLTDFGLSLAGTLVDPVNLGLMFATEGLGDAALAGMGWRTAEGVGAVGRLANAVRVPAEGLIGNVPFVAGSAALTDATGDDFSLGEGLTDLAAGAVFHTGMHLAFRAAKPLFTRGDGLDAEANPHAPEEAPPPAEENLVPTSGVPDDVNTLPQEARVGAFAKAVDDAADDRPVDVGQYVEKELSPELGKLDETPGAAEIASFHPGEEGVAITTRGTEVPVQYGLVELGDLVTSHNDDLSVNPAFPEELQPRDRERAGAIARNLQLEAELNPKRLMMDTAADGGSPIVSRAGVVESGNGRTIALRRSAAKGGEAYTRYRAELESRFPEAADMDKPVLVRMRTEPMTGSARSALAREMNADVTERMSASEQAMADARAIEPGMLDHLDGTIQGRRAFARAFLAKVAPDQVNALTASDQALSRAGEDRIAAALTARAYGDPRLVEAIHDDADSHIKALGAALKSAAGSWAQMRADIAAGKVPAALDVTGALRAAVDLVRHARDARISVPDFLKERLEQQEMFAGSEISPETEAFLRLMFRDPDFRQPRAADKVAEALDHYATAARDYTPGPNLFGDEADGQTARQLLENLAQKFAAGDDGEPDLLRPPGRTDADRAGAAAEPGGGPGGEAQVALLDVRPAGGERAGPGERDLSTPGGDNAPAEGGGAGPGGVEEPAAAPRGAAFIAADPELKALQADTERLAAIHGVEDEVPEAQDPNTLAEAIRAAGVCLEGEL